MNLRGRLLHRPNGLNLPAAGPPTTLGDYAPIRPATGSRGRSPVGIRFAEDHVRNQRRRVSADDELSSANSSQQHSPSRQTTPPPNRVPQANLLTGPTIPHLPGFNTPPVIQPISYIGTPILQATPQQQLTPSEQQLINMFRAQQVLTQHRFERAQRPRHEPEPIHRPVLLRHQLPLSSSSTLSAQPVSTLSGTATQMVSSPLTG